MNPLSCNLMHDLHKNTAPGNILKLFSRISSVHTYKARAPASEHFILKNLDSMSNEMLFRVLGSKFGTVYLKLRKRKKRKD